MAATVRQIADWISGEVVGDAELRIEEARPLNEARPGDLTYLDKKLRHVPTDCPAAAFVVSHDFPLNGKTVIRTTDPLMGFAEAMRRLRRVDERPPPGIHPLAVVHPSAQVADDAFVDAFVVIGEGCVIGPRARLDSGVRLGREVILGEDVTLFANTVINDRCVIGNRVRIHPNVTIGADGFGYQLRDGQHVKVPQLGHVELGDDVEIGAGSAVDRGTFGATRIGSGTKIDNLVQIAHNCRLGRHNLLAGQVGLAGSVTTGDYVILAGQSGVSDHTTVGAGVVVGAQAGVMRDLPPGSQRYWGTPAIPQQQYNRMQITLSRLTTIWRDLLKIVGPPNEEKPEPEADT